MLTDDSYLRTESKAPKLGKGSCRKLSHLSKHAVLWLSTVVALLLLRSFPSRTNLLYLYTTYLFRYFNQQLYSQRQAQLKIKTNRTHTESNKISYIYSDIIHIYSKTKLSHILLYNIYLCLLSRYKYKLYFSNLQNCAKIL